MRGVIGAVDAESIGQARFEAFHLRAPDVAFPSERDTRCLPAVVIRVEQAKLDPLRVLREKGKPHASIHPLGAQAPFRLTHLSPA